jgi:hypothetical protein
MRLTTESPGTMAPGGTPRTITRALAIGRGNAEHRSRSEKKRARKITHDKARLCWTRRDLVEATGLSYRTIVNLEVRGLLRRVPVGVNVAVYSAASVGALFRDSLTTNQEAPMTKSVSSHTAYQESCAGSVTPKISPSPAVSPVMAAGSLAVAERAEYRKLQPSPNV